MRQDHFPSDNDMRHGRFLNLTRDLGTYTHTRSGKLSESRRDCQRNGGDCQKVGETFREMGETVRKSERLSESRGDCQRVDETVGKSGRVSESWVDCQKVGNIVRANLLQ